MEKLSDGVLRFAREQLFAPFRITILNVNEESESARPELAIVLAFTWLRMNLLPMDVAAILTLKLSFRVPVYRFHCVQA